MMTAMQTTIMFPSSVTTGIHFTIPLDPAIDPFGGLADFDPAVGRERYEIECLREKAVEYETALRVLDECLKPPKKAKIADLRRHIEMAREEISRVRWRWM